MIRSLSHSTAPPDATPAEGEEPSIYQEPDDSSEAMDPGLGDFSHSRWVEEALKKVQPQRQRQRGRSRHDLHVHPSPPRTPQYEEPGHDSQTRVGRGQSRRQRGEEREDSRASLEPRRYNARASSRRSRSSSAARFDASGEDEQYGASDFDALETGPLVFLDSASAEPVRGRRSKYPKRSSLDEPALAGQATGHASPSDAEGQGPFPAKGGEAKTVAAKSRDHVRRKASRSQEDPSLSPDAPDVEEEQLRQRRKRPSKRASSRGFTGTQDRGEDGARDVQADSVRGAHRRRDTHEGRSRMARSSQQAPDSELAIEFM